ncbi:laminarinase [Coprinellus micaceus]|uniref:Laminarinase n=1 Tax=Coprinellus micaceus TaxID=71717 RepID=A0A4Y7T344_COPMI|nr:laminarinase [Coprinellus micaceus]
MLTYFLFPILLCLNAPAVLGANYALSEAIIGPAFYDKFIWFYAADPSHGRVNYTDKDTSKRLNLTYVGKLEPSLQRSSRWALRWTWSNACTEFPTYASSNSFILRADYKTVLNPSGAGRNSVRTFVICLKDVVRTWPAIWETKAAVWPTGGEVDVLEGVHGKAPNVATLHTTAERHLLPRTTAKAGVTSGSQRLKALVPASTRTGVDGLLWRGGQTFIKMWFWHRMSGNVPAFISNPTEKLNTDGWGTPAAFFPNTTCDMTKHFMDHHIIINLTFCGDWAGPAYASSGCPTTCADFVNKNTDYFKDAYFDIAAVRIYKQA